MSTTSPDIILIVADDVNLNILRQSNCPYIKSMMGSGANFTKAFNYGGSGGAVCISSRQMMLFGQPWDSKNINRIHNLLMPQIDIYEPRTFNCRRCTALISAVASGSAAKTSISSFSPSISCELRASTTFVR